MPFWEIRGTNKTVQATADNWLTAVSSSLENLGLDKNAISRMVCDIQPDGVVSIRDPKTGVGLAVRQIAQAAAAVPSTGGAAAPVPQVTTASSIADEHLVTGSTPDDEPPPDLVEQLFDREMEIEMAEELDTAAETALNILREFVPAESGSVLHATINDIGLKFISAQGPAADKIKDYEIPFGQGIAGFSYDTGMSLIVQNAASDRRHHREADQLTGYHTGSVLVAALKDLDGDIHGVIELLNPPTRFLPWHLDAAFTVAKALAEYIRVRTPTQPSSVMR